MALILTTGAATLLIEGSLTAEPWKFAAFMAGLYLTGGCANSLNQYFERKIDARMTRTCGKRPLPLKKITPAQALIFSVVIGLSGIVLLALIFNFLTAVLATSTILFYSLIYTLLLKPYTSQNIVIGGLAGAMTPLGAWTAATGSIALTPGLLSLLIFLWTPPHFWSLAMHFKSDYKTVRLPMMPVVRGDKATFDHILIYTIILVILSFLLPLAGFGWFYSAVAFILGVTFIERVVAARRRKDAKRIWGLFRYSIFYLFSLFSALVIDRIF
jgi:protoheme IX farnesyltransferase